jgi:hypothetical protein
LYDSIKYSQLIEQAVSNVDALFNDEGLLRKMCFCICSTIPDKNKQQKIINRELEIVKGKLNTTVKNNLKIIEIVDQIEILKSTHANSI